MMSQVHQVDCVNRSLRDIPIGSVPIVFGEDPPQILPVVKGHK